MNKHRSEKLDNMLGKRVLVFFFGNSCDLGVLEWDKYFNRYRVGDTIFYKSNVKKIIEAD